MISQRFHSNPRAEAYCDGSVSPALMKGVTSSSLNYSSQIGRIAVLIPALDLGLLERMREGVLTAKGNPDSLQMEILAIRRAGTILVQKGVEHFVIFTDNPDAVVRAGVDAVRWTPPVPELCWVSLGEIDEAGSVSPSESEKGQV